MSDVGDDLENIIDRIINSDTDDFFKLSKLAGLDNLTDFVGANLSGVDLSRKNLKMATFDDADLSGAILSRADLSGAILFRANLSRADLLEANLLEANLSRAILLGANLSDIKVESARFGNNLGISEDIKQELENKGAMFDDSPGDRAATYSLK